MAPGAALETAVSVTDIFASSTCLFQPRFTGRKPADSTRRPNSSFVRCCLYLVELTLFSFTPARFLLSLRSRERYCHALCVRSPSWGFLPDARWATSLHLSCTGRPMHRELNKWFRTFALGSMSRVTRFGLFMPTRKSAHRDSGACVFMVPVGIYNRELVLPCPRFEFTIRSFTRPRQLLINRRFRPLADWMVVFNVNRCVWTLVAPRTRLGLSR